MPMPRKVAETIDADSRAKFVRLANKRVPVAVKAIELVGNLSNRNNYGYTEADSKAVLKALRTAVGKVEEQFGGRVPTENGFRLE